MNLNVGWEEWVSLPELGLPSLVSKTDTGAATSALHAFNIQPFGSKTRPKVRFGINPIEDNNQFAIYCSANVSDVRTVTSSNGMSELRYVIETELVIGDVKKKIEITLTNRENMKYKMILGRSALDGFTVQPEISFEQGFLSYDLYKNIKKQVPARRSLRIAILTIEPNNYSTKRLVEAAEARDHVCELINTRRCYLNIQSHKPEVHYEGEALPHFDAIIPRIGSSITFYGMAVVRQFQAMGTYCLNSSSSIGLSRDKLAAHQTLVSHRIPMPNTAFANSPHDTESLIDLASGAPLVLKLLESTQGKGVLLAESRKAAAGVISAFQKLNAPFIVQEFVKEASGSDIRCLVIGNKVVASMMRTAGDEDFRANLHAGGSAKKIIITKEERKISIQATKALGLSFAGVDIIRTGTGPKVLEVNSSPGLEGIEKVSKKDIAGLIIEHLEIKAGIIKP
ncbi:30S ribosomal protein S6--L-glutamate ligase [Gammaproteobacteria bacterium]|nr:30S ribosomal protein S6--L-glutamate ligase [Gammaproteobacteria bacterium]